MIPSVFLSIGLYKILIKFFVNINITIVDLSFLVTHFFANRN